MLVTSNWFGNRMVYLSYDLVVEVRHTVVVKVRHLFVMSSLYYTNPLHVNSDNRCDVKVAEIILIPCSSWFNELGICLWWWWTTSWIIVVSSTERFALSMTTSWGGLQLSRRGQRNSSSRLIMLKIFELGSFWNWGYLPTIANENDNGFFTIR